MDESNRTTESVDSPVVMITAHGVSDREKAHLLAAGKRIVDTTCPLVKKAHTIAMALARDGHFVVVAGKRDHVEVRGLTGDLARFAIVETDREVQRWQADKIAVIAQTTAVEGQVRSIVQQVKHLNPQATVRFVNTICQPTRDRQMALEALIGKVDVLVVVGGFYSNNTRQLVARAQSAGIRTLQVEGPQDLQPYMFQGWETVGLTAGTSTLPETVDAVRRRLQGLAVPREHSSELNVELIAARGN